MLTMMPIAVPGVIIVLGLVFSVLGLYWAFGEDIARFRLAASQRRLVTATVIAMLLASAPIFAIDVVYNCEWDYVLNVWCSGSTACAWTTWAWWGCWYLP